MGRLAEVWRRLLFLFRRRQLDRDLEEEMRFHLEMKARESGAAAAQRAFGNAALLREDCREAWGWRWLDVLASDVRFALRLMRRNPAFTCIAILTLGLAIGGNALVFSLVDAVVLRPLPYAEPDRLFYLWTVEAAAQRAMNTSYPDFRDWREQSHVFASMAAFSQWSFNLTGGGEPERVDALTFTPGLLELLGIRPALGRTFRADDGSRTALLGYGLWARRFGGDPGAIGRSVQLDGEAYTILGVCPAGFHFPPNRFSGDPEIFVPLVPNLDRTAWSLRVIGRLRPGAGIERAQAEMGAIGRRVAETYPNERRGQGIKLDAITAYVAADSRDTALVLLGAVAFVLLIACANVANLLLSQGAARRREIAIRVAIGASRGRIIRQLLLESALLGMASAVAGIALARIGLPALAAIAPERTAFFTRVRDNGVHLNLTVLAFTAVVSLVASMLFGTLPALRTTRPRADLARGAGSGRLRGALVAVEICLAFILLAGAGLMINSMARLMAVDLGFLPERLLTMEVGLPHAKYPNEKARTAFFARALAGLEASPGVLSVAAASDLPLERALSTGQIRVGNPPVIGRAAFHAISPRYFQTMEIPLIRGRLFNAADTAQSAGVVIVNRRFAERYWPHDDALGKVVVVYGVRVDLTPEGPKLRPAEEPLVVVGVVGDVRLIARDAPPSAELFRPYTQQPQSGMSIVLRTAGNPESLVEAVRKEIWRADADQPTTDLKPMQAWVATDVAERRFVLLLVGAFAASALLLAAIGIYGVVSYAVRQRTQEIGVRMALGARGRDVAALVLRQTAVWVTAGMVAGIASALGLTRLLTAYLYEVKPADAPTFAAVAAALAGIAVAANLPPARSAVKVDPLEALRHE